MKTLLIAALLVSTSAFATEWRLVNSQMIDVQRGLWSCTYQAVGSSYIQVVNRYNYCPYAFNY